MWFAIGLLLSICTFAVPTIFIYIKNGSNKFVFVLSVLGIGTVVSMVLSVVELLLAYINHDLLPSIYSDGSPKYMWTFFRIIEWMDDNIRIIEGCLVVLSSFISPFFLYRFGQIFSSHRTT